MKPHIEGERTVKDLIPNELLSIGPLNGLRDETSTRVSRLMIQYSIQELVAKLGERESQLNVRALGTEVISQHIVRHQKTERSVVDRRNPTLGPSKDGRLVETPHVVEKGWNNKKLTARREVLL
jgi:hypothetical protein